MNAVDKILRARSILILDHPFFGSLALRLDLVEDNSFETMATDGQTLQYNSKYVDKLSIKEMLGVLAHEVMHSALGHIWRQGNRDHQKWNIAADYAINHSLITTGFTLPDGVLVNNEYADLSAEEIYSLLEDQNQGQSQNQNSSNKSDPGKCGAVLPAENKQQEKEIKAKWQAAVNQAVQISKGSLPDNVKRQIQKFLNPEVPWHILLRDFVEHNARNDYNWAKPSRRYLYRDLVLPSLISESLPKIIIAIDTSGSINNKALTKFATEASNVLESYDTTIEVIYCDAKIQKKEVFTRTDMPLKMNPKGGGGTDFRPVFDHIEKYEEPPSCLIYFTDMYGQFPNQTPPYPTMWLATEKNRKAPFGITVNFK